MGTSLPLKGTEAGRLALGFPGSDAQSIPPPPHGLASGARAILSLERSVLSLRTPATAPFKRSTGVGPPRRRPLWMARTPVLVPVKRHRGEQGHTCARTGKKTPGGAGTRTTRAHGSHGSHRRTSQPSKPTNPRPSPYPPTHSRPVATHTPWHGFPVAGLKGGHCPLAQPRYFTQTTRFRVVQRVSGCVHRTVQFRTLHPSPSVLYPGTNTQLQAYTGDSESVERRRGEPGAGSRDTHRIAHSLNGTHRARCSVLERRYKAKGGTAHLSLLSLTSYQTVLPLDPA
jgi:hypothetical protein